MGTRTWMLTLVALVSCSSGGGGATIVTPTATALATASPSATAQPAPQRMARVPYAVTPAAKAAVGATDRSEDDRAKDVRRYPAELLSFMQLAPGMRVADLGTGDGYTMELIVRMVGPDGKVFGQNNKRTLEKFVSESWPARLTRPINKDVVRVDRELMDPLPPEAINLDMVTMIFYYHDAVAQDVDRTVMNKKIFDALKPGGLFVIADHHAKSGSGTAIAALLHRLDVAIAKKEIIAAGFKLEEEAHFLRDPSDPLDDKSFERKFVTDRYALRFRKPK